MRYQDIERIGAGVFGVVYKAFDTATNRLVALKQMRLEQEEQGLPITAIREISMLKVLKHPNVVQLHDVLYDSAGLYLVLEFVDLDLRRVMDSVPNFGSNHRVIKLLLFQMIEGISYCHMRQVLHRDLKPQNVLVDRETQSLKLADFGLARAFGVPVRAYTHEVVTLWYRAPEILLGARVYLTPVDMWSIGCIFAEMVNLRPLFPGESEIDELYKIFRILGTPDEESWPGVSQLPDWHNQFPKWEPQNMADVVPALDAAGVDLLSSMLVYSPQRRITAQRALQHEYFHDIAEIQQEYQHGAFAV